MIRCITCGKDEFFASYCNNKGFCSLQFQQAQLPVATTQPSNSSKPTEHASPIYNESGLASSLLLTTMIAAGAATLALSSSEQSSSSNEENPKLAFAIISAVFLTPIAVLTGFYLHAQNLNNFPAIGVSIKPNGDPLIQSKTASRDIYNNCDGWFSENCIYLTKTEAGKPLCIYYYKNEDTYEDYYLELYNVEDLKFTADQRTELRESGHTNFTYVCNNNEYAEILSQLKIKDRIFVSPKP